MNPIMGNTINSTLNTQVSSFYSLSTPLGLSVRIVTILPQSIHVPCLSTNLMTLTSPQNPLHFSNEPFITFGLNNTRIFPSSNKNPLVLMHYLKHDVKPPPKFYILILTLLGSIFFLRNPLGLFTK